MELMLSLRKKSIVVTLSIIIAAVLIGYKLVHKVNLITIERLKMKVENSKRVNVLLAEIKVLQDKFSLYKNIEAETHDADWIISKTASIADACRIKIDSMDPLKPAQYQGFTVLGCRMVFETPYKRLGNFIAKLEQDKRFIKMDNFTINTIKISIKRQDQPSAPGGGIFGQQDQPFQDSHKVEVVKRTTDEGVWVKVEMDVSGFYSG